MAEPFDSASGSNPEDELREMIRKLMSGEGGIDPSALAGAAGLPSDPAAMAQLMAQLQNAVASSSDGINWQLAIDQATQQSRTASLTPTDAQRREFDGALGVASLWLDEVTDISELPTTPRLLSRTEWVQQTMPLWTQLAEPVATSITEALTESTRGQLPEEMAGLIGDPSNLLRGIGGTLFAVQLGHVVAQLGTEVVSGGDIGIPLLEDRAAILPQNVQGFAEGLDIPADQVALYLAVRELAHARLFRHARWLRSGLISSITEFAHGISIDLSSFEEALSDLDPSNPEQLRQALTSGRFIPPRSPEQQVALERLETMLALVEGWVDVVTAAATARLPKSDAVAETVRRRRAAGGPAESAFASLVGLELRPRRLREAAAMWQKVGDRLGAEKRDSLWSHPDLLPTAADIDDPEALITRLETPEGTADDIDQAIEDLLRDDGDRPTES
jgi:putative hydrolase